MEHVFAFGSCRMRMLGCSYYVTVLSSIPEVQYRLDVIEGMRSVPECRWLRELLCYEQADDEPWAYDLSVMRSVVVEVCTAKTLWYGDYPISMLKNYRQRTQGIETTLKVADAACLQEQLRLLRERLAGRFIVFVCPQSFVSDDFSMYWATVEARKMLRNVIFDAATKLADCAAYDPTTRVEELGAKHCLLDAHHWTEAGGLAFSDDIKHLIPESCR